MRKAITLRAFPPAMKTLDRVDLAREAGYEGVEVNLEPAEEFPLDSEEANLRQLRKEIEARGMVVSAVYSREQWKFPITSLNPETRTRGRTIIERLAWAAAQLGTDAVLVVPGAVDNGIFVDPPEIVPYDAAYRNAHEVLGEIARGAGEQHRVYLAIENVWGKFLLSPLEFAAFVDTVQSPWAGVYFDVGNVLRMGFPEHWIPILGGRIKRVHFKDFRQSVGNLNGFVNLLEGDVNWPAVKHSLMSIGYDSWVTAEVLPTYRYHSERLVYETSASIDAILGDQI
jgi:L-ribulose-5-phosphate 3-epimerase